MEYEQALIIGRRRRADAAMALGGYMREKAMTEVRQVKGPTCADTVWRTRSPFAGRAEVASTCRANSR